MERALMPMQETQEMRVPSLGWGDPLKEGMANHLPFLPGNPINRGAWRAMLHRVAKSQTWLNRLTCRHTRNIYKEILT